jgi:hypothetical protein
MKLRRPPLQPCFWHINIPSLVTGLRRLRLGKTRPDRADES